MIDLDKLLEELGSEDRDPMTLKREGKCPTFSSLNDFYEGRLQGKEKRELTTHLAKCEFCMHTVGRFFQEERESPALSARSWSDRLTAWLAGLFAPPEGGMGWAFKAGAPALGAVAVVCLVWVSLPMEFDAHLVGRHIHQIRDSQEFEVREGDTLYSGDRFKIEVGASRDAYVYLIGLHHGGEFQQIFPNPERPANNLVSKGERRVFPERFWYLDENTGTETMFILASRAPVDDLDGILDGIEEGTAGFADPVEMVDRAIEVLEQDFDKVEVVSFRHR